MKLIHISDIHLGSPLTAHLAPERARERRRELMDTFRRTVDEGVRLGARGVIIAGDLFDTESVSERTLDGVIDVIEKHPEVTFFYLAGNHERSALIDGVTVLPENLLMFGEDWTYFEAGDLTVAGRSRPMPDMFDSLRLDPKNKNIVVLHGELRERSAAGGVIGKREARGRYIDYLALGHYHSYSYEILDTRCTAVYSGTPEGRGFDETGEKGFVLIDTDTPHLDHRLIPFAKRAVHIVYADITTAKTSTEISRAVEREVAAIPREDIVRVELCGDCSPTLTKDEDIISYGFGERFYHFELRDRSRLAIDPADYENDRSLKGEFIRRVYGDSTLDEKTKSDIVACGLAALRGESCYGG